MSTLHVYMLLRSREHLLVHRRTLNWIDRFFVYKGDVIVLAHQTMSGNLQCWQLAISALSLSLTCASGTGRHFVVQVQIN